MSENPKDPSGYDELQESIARGDTPMSASVLDRRDRALRRSGRARERQRQQQMLGSSAEEAPIDAYLAAAYPGYYCKVASFGMMQDMQRRQAEMSQLVVDEPGLAVVFEPVLAVISELLAGRLDVENLLASTGDALSYMQAEINHARTIGQRSADVIREVEAIAQQDVALPDEMSDEPSVAWAQGYHSAVVALLQPFRNEPSSAGPVDVDEAGHG